jgi:hypothetical protein
LVGLLRPGLRLGGLVGLLRPGLRLGLLRGGARGLLWLTLLLFRLSLFAFLLVLGVSRDNRPEEQNQGSGTCSFKEIHGNRLRYESLFYMHADGQYA